MLKIYCYPRCTTCQRATKYLDAKSVEYEYINIKENNPDKETLRSLWQKSGLDLKKFFNTSGILYREMELSQDFSLSIGTPDTIIYGNTNLYTLSHRNTDGDYIFTNNKIDLTSVPSIEIKATYKSISAGFVKNPYGQNEIYMLAKTKISF